MVVHRINPKSISLENLYGIFDPDTKNWSDGVLPLIMRECASDLTNLDKQWIVFDGPVLILRKLYCYLY